MSYNLFMKFFIEGSLLQQFWIKIKEFIAEKITKIFQIQYTARNILS